MSLTTGTKALDGSIDESKSNPASKEQMDYEKISCLAMIINIKNCSGWMWQKQLLWLETANAWRLYWYSKNRPNWNKPRSSKIQQIILIQQRVFLFNDLKMPEQGNSIDTAASKGSNGAGCSFNKKNAGAKLQHTKLSVLIVTNDLAPKQASAFPAPDDDAR